MLIKVILFSVLAIGLSSGEGNPFSAAANKEYEGYLPKGDPIFAISNANIEQEIRVIKDGETGLEFRIQHGNTEMKFKYLKETYLLQSVKFTFKSKQTLLDLVFFEENNRSTPMVFKTHVYTSDSNPPGPAIKSAIFGESKLSFLLGSKDVRKKPVVASLLWISELLTAQKPMFYRVERGPAVVHFVMPPVVVSPTVHQQLVKLKNKMKKPLVAAFADYIGIGKKKPILALPAPKN